MPASGSSPFNSTASASPPERPFTWRFTTPLFLGSAFNPINTSLIATALVPIADGLGETIGRTATLVTVLYLAGAVAQPSAGRAAEVFGPRRVLIGGIVLVVIGGLVGGFAQNLVTLLVSRVLIGLGTSCGYPTAMLLIQRRARAAGLDRPPGGVLGGLQISGMATAALGLPLGGVLVGLLGWRAAFFVNVPVPLIALAMVLAWIPSDGRLDRTHRPRDIAAGLDIAGIAGFAAAMVTLLLFLFELPTARWYLLGISVVLWIALVVWELRARAPFLDFRMLAVNRALTRTYVQFGLVLLCVYAVLYGVTPWVQTVRGLSETEAGLLLLPMTVASGLIIMPVSRRNLVHGPVIAAAVLCLGGSVGVLLLHGSTWIGWVVLVGVAFGLAMGLASAGDQTAIYGLAPAGLLGTAAGLLRTFASLGSIAASVVTGVVFRADISDQGLHLMAQIMIGVSVAAVLIAIADRALRRSSRRSSG